MRLATVSGNGVEHMEAFKILAVSAPFPSEFIRLLSSPRVNESNTTWKAEGLTPSRFEKHNDIEGDTCLTHDEGFWRARDSIKVTDARFSSKCSSVHFPKVKLPGRNAFVQAEVR